MTKTVWGDLLFFVNFCMDFQCLFLSAKLLRRPFSVCRGALVSALGAVYAVAVLFWQTSGLSALLADLGVGLLMCMGVFLERDLKIRRILIPFGVYFVVSFAVGRAMSGMAALLSHVELPLGESSEVSSPFFFLLAAAGGVVTFLWGRFCERRTKGSRAMLRLVLEGREITLRCMVDTANLLRDPVSGKCVVIVSDTRLEALLPQELAAVVAGGDPTTLSTLPLALARRVRLLPTAAVTGERLLMAVLPDRALVDDGSGPHPVELLVAFAPLAGNTDDCEALLPAELLG